MILISVKNIARILSMETGWGSNSKHTLNSYGKQGLGRLNSEEGPLQI